MRPRQQQPCQRQQQQQQQSRRGRRRHRRWPTQSAPQQRQQHFFHTPIEHDRCRPPQTQQFQQPTDINSRRPPTVGRIATGHHQRGEQPQEAQEPPEIRAQEVNAPMAQLAASGHDSHTNSRTFSLTKSGWRIHFICFLYTLTREFICEMCVRLCSVCTTRTISLSLSVCINSPPSVPLLPWHPLVYEISFSTIFLSFAHACHVIV